jgi:hypothetical protein
MVTIDPSTTMARKNSRFADHLRRMWILVSIFVCLLAAGSIRAQTVAPRLSVDSAVATAGFFQLSWEIDAEQVELQEAADQDFRNPTTPYIGPDRAAVISGKPDGQWYYRVRAANGSETGPWSAPIEVNVSHHSLARALLFLALGITVFVAIVITVVRGTGKAP